MDMKRHYYEDVQLFTSGVIVFWFCAFIIFLALFPLLFKNYYVYLANYMAINVIVAIGRIEFFGGRQGLHAPDLTIGPWHLDTDIDFYYLLITLTVLLTVAARNISKTRVGRAFIAIRDADIAAETMGVNLVLYKTLAFAVSAFYAGIAGGKNITPQYIENKLKASVYINDAVVIGDRRKYLTCLIMIDEDNVVKYAQDHKIQFSTYKDLTLHDDVRKLVQDEIKAVNETLARVEQVKKFCILPKKLYEEDGEVTPTMKVKRKFVNEAFSELIDSMY